MLSLGLWPLLQRIPGLFPFAPCVDALRTHQRKHAQQDALPEQSPHNGADLWRSLALRSAKEASHTGTASIVVRFTNRARSSHSKPIYLIHTYQPHKWPYSLCKKGAASIRSVPFHKTLRRETQ